MIEVKRARQHLLVQQALLHLARSQFRRGPVIDAHENCVMAALSWVWDAQERAGLNAWKGITPMAGVIREGDVITSRDFGTLVVIKAGR